VLMNRGDVECFVNELVDNFEIEKRKRFVSEMFMWTCVDD